MHLPPVSRQHSLPHKDVLRVFLQNLPQLFQMPSYLPEEKRLPLHGLSFMIVGDPYDTVAAFLGEIIQNTCDPAERFPIKLPVPKAANVHKDKDQRILWMKARFTGS